MLDTVFSNWHAFRATIVIFRWPLIFYVLNCLFPLIVTKSSGPRCIIISCVVFYVLIDCGRSCTLMGSCNAECFPVCSLSRCFARPDYLLEFRLRCCLVFLKQDCSTYTSSRGYPGAKMFRAAERLHNFELTGWNSRLWRSAFTFRVVRTGEHYTTAPYRSLLERTEKVRFETRWSKMARTEPFRPFWILIICGFSTRPAIVDDKTFLPVWEKRPIIGLSHKSNCWTTFLCMYNAVRPLQIGLSLTLKTIGMSL